MLGNTGMKVGVIALGCEGMLEDECRMTAKLIDEAEKNGVNYFDLYASDPKLHRALGAALKGRRERFLIQGHLCSVWKDGQYKRSRELNEVKEGFENQLKNLGTDYLDVGMIHYVDAVEDWDTVVKNGILDYAEALKKQGRIRHIGMSSHNPLAALKAIETGRIEVLMFSVNPCYDLLPASEDIDLLFSDKSYEKPLLNMDRDRERLYEMCQRMGVGITVMKAFGGGDLLNADSPAGMALTPVQCIHYALTRPAVTAVLSGAHSVEQLDESLKYLSADEKARDYAEAFAKMPKVSWKGHCMYCSHCAPCPVKISVADVTKYMALCAAQGSVPETVREHYALPVRRRYPRQYAQGRRDLRLLKELFSIGKGEGPSRQPVKKLPNPL